MRSQSLGSRGVKAHGGVVAGRDVSFVHAGVELRMGGNEAAASSALLRFAPTPPWGDGMPVHGFSAMLGAGARGVARNALLERTTTASGPLSRRRAVGRVVAGVTCRSRGRAPPSSWRRIRASSTPSARRTASDRWRRASPSDNRP